MASDDNEEKSVGIGEIAAGTAAGAAAVHFAGGHLAKKQFEGIASQAIIVGTEAEKAFKVQVPKPNMPNLSGMGREAMGHAAEQYKGAIAAWEANKATAVGNALAPLEKEIESLASPLKRPLAAFKNASALGKTGMVAAVVAGAVGAGCLINKWRNSGEESHVERLERERSRTGPRER